MPPSTPATAQPTSEPATGHWFMAAVFAAILYRDLVVPYRFLTNLYRQPAPTVCPDCADVIRPEAKACKHCGSCSL